MANFPTAPTGGSTTNPNVTLPAPTNASEWAYALLITMGINPATHQNALWNLAAQINLEQGSNAVSGNNPLNSTQPEGGSVGGGTQGDIQNYPTWLDGLQGNISVLQQSNQKSLYNALVNNDDITDFAAALGQADWEGGGSGAPGNVQYGLSVEDRFNSMLKGGSNSFAALSSGYLNYPSGGAAVPTINLPGPGIGDLPAATVGVASTAAGSALSKLGLGGLDTLINDIVNGFGIGWKAVLTIIVGGLLIIIGVYVIFHKQVNQAAEVAAVA